MLVFRLFAASDEQFFGTILVELRISKKKKTNIN
jgi:hypothetical protein